MFNVTKLMAVKVKRFKSLEDKNAFHYYFSKATEIFISVMLTLQKCWCFIVVWEKKWLLYSIWPMKQRFITPLLINVNTSIWVIVTNRQIPPLMLVTMHRNINTISMWLKSRPNSLPKHCNNYFSSHKIFCLFAN